MDRGQSRGRVGSPRFSPVRLSMATTTTSSGGSMGPRTSNNQAIPDTLFKIGAERRKTQANTNNCDE